jgi:hypothetical protein
MYIEQQIRVLYQLSHTMGVSFSDKVCYMLQIKPTAVMPHASSGLGFHDKLLPVYLKCQYSLLQLMPSLFYTHALSIE